MAARDRETIEIKCPKCGRGGTVRISTGDHPYMKTDEFLIDNLPPGFTQVKRSNWRSENTVKCEHCGTEFRI
jgi:ribosomal protein S27E